MKMADRLRSRFTHWVDDMTKDPRRAKFTSALILGAGGSGKTALRHVIAKKAECVHETTIRAFEQIQDAPLPCAFINALIVVVDAVDLEACEHQVSISPSRVHGHLLTWNRETLGEICSMLSPALEYVCIFVNKVDALRPEDQRSMRLKTIFAELKATLAAESGGARVEILCGSARTGAGIERLRERLSEIG
jgi:hypothetical protein